MGKIKFSHWMPRRPRMKWRFKKFKVITKTKNALKILVSKNKALQKALKTVFSKKALKIAAAGTAIGIGVNYVMNYIESNSGCFLKTSNEICKVRELSCCQQKAVQGVPFCSNQNNRFVDLCKGFDIEKENSCCRQCDCKLFGCLPHQKMECQRPTVAEALSHFGKDLSAGILENLLDIFPWLEYIFYLLGGIFFLWFTNLVYNRFQSKKYE